MPPHPNPLPVGEGAVSPCFVGSKEVITAYSVDPLSKIHLPFDTSFAEGKFITPSWYPRSLNQINHGIFSPLDRSPLPVGRGLG
ncbi:hypothetical protein FHU10_3646 [Serratia fonticola]|uniref:Uncharacterized protein n=1 Tax=Serratia fonticola TaxID=47917 RepID=A0A542BS92_SERFO|nr:hypothetical protein FHU09_4060 [Serratia fonticola]TQI96543.1 hypothetical protein FHU11_1985 [Serratia fonticola]TVZ71040.1 hypothetical protein FHU10_3646 [Serratia fonticola]